MGSSVNWDDMVPAYTSNYAGAVVLDGGLNIRAADDLVVARSGFSRESLLTMTALDVVHPDDVLRAGQGLHNTRSAHGVRLPGLYRLRFADDRYHLFEVRSSNVGTRSEPALAIQFFEPTEDLQTVMFAEGMVQLMQTIVDPDPTTTLLRRFADFAETHVRDLTMAITVFEPDGSTTTIEADGLPSAAVAENRSAHPLSLPPHVLQALEARDEPNVGTMDDRVPGRITSVVVDDDCLLGYIEAFRPTFEPPTDLEWLVYGSVQQMLATALIRRRLDRRLRFAADHDPLTGLMNRRRLLTDMEHAESLAGTAILLVDLDSFSWINNTLGHAAGDRALVSLAERLQVNAPSGARVSRWGGDEFVVWIPHETSIEEAGRIAERIRSNMVVPVSVADRRASVRGSIGAAVIRAGEDSEQAVNRADQAMYEAKRSGGDQVRAERSSSTERA